MLILLALPPSARAAGLQLRIQPGTARPGDLVLVTVRGLNAAPGGSVGDRALVFHPIRGGHQAVAALPVELTPGEREVKVWRADKSAGEPVITGTVDVVPPGFPERELQVDNKYVQPPLKVRKWIAADRAAFARAFAQTRSARRFSKAFAWPLRPVVTARFGDLRTYNGKKQSQHYGLDLDGAVGDPVYAANDGAVVLSRNCYGSGETVIVHHGASLYTAYFHLSHRAVRPGMRLKQGQLLGKVGATGRVTGPHLHWGVKVDGLWANPESLLPLDFE